MKFVSTRGGNESVTFTEALSKGLTKDGGLFVPELFPNFKMEIHSSYSAFAEMIVQPFFEGSELASHSKEICQKALNFPIPLKFLKNEPSTAILELFHGPTAAFKDVGARFLAQCESKLDRKKTVLVATSGDTGGAVAAAFSETETPVIILYPKNKVSLRQERQLTTWGPKVRAFQVRGSFDDCQRIVKEALADRSLLLEHHFISANSINIGRLLAQVCYHARSSLEYFQVTGKKPTLIVPTGNLGNGVAALWAMAMGFPIAQVVLATNANRTIPDYFSTGKFEPSKAVSTLANAMDVSNPSNFERMIHLFSKTDPEICSVSSVSAISVPDVEIANAIAEGKSRYGEIWCPHTATGIVAKEHLQRKKVLSETSASIDVVISATAHPAKFETVVEPLINETVVIPKALQASLEGTSVSVEIDSTYQDLLHHL